MVVDNILYIQLMWLIERNKQFAKQNMRRERGRERNRRLGPVSFLSSTSRYPSGLGFLDNFDESTFIWLLQMVFDHGWTGLDTVVIAFYMFWAIDISLCFLDTYFWHS